MKSGTNHSRGRHHGWSAALLGTLLAMSAADLAGAAEPAAAAIPPARFLAALDLHGTTHRIGNGEGYRAVALVFMSHECPISRQYVPELNRLAAALTDKPVKYVGVISERGLSRAAAARFQQEFKVAFPILFDASGEIAAAFAPTHVPEAFVLDADGRVVYRGRIDDQYAEVGKKRPAPASKHDFAEAIGAALDGIPPAVAQTTPVGCPFEAEPVTKDPSKITFTRDVAPILFANCTECHRPGEVAPFSLRTYDDASKRAAFLSEITRSRQMPPWKAEIGHTRFLGERRLTDLQIAIIDAWAQNGAPRGSAEDLPPEPRFASGWRLGKPHLELKAPVPLSVPAAGEDIFQHFVIPIDIPEDKTVVGFEFRPGNPAVVHHAILFLDNSGMARKKDAATPEPGYVTFGSIGIPVSGIIGVWTPGMTPRFYPQGAGMMVQQGTDLVLQLHIHPSGKEETDQSSIALYFADKAVERNMSRAPFVVGSLMIDIPPGAKDHTIRSTVTLPTDITLISLLPHMHLVGKEMRLTAAFPDGKLEDLIWIKNWNFYWQDNYVYHSPVKLPAGTRLEVVSRYDNSDDNPFNPSKPAKRVFFGNGSDDEMCFGIFQLIVDKPLEERKLQGALFTTLLRDWNNSELDDEARGHILDEAAKLFGGGRGQFAKLLGPGRKPGDAPKQ
jgi:thiol-disulfide isomerase/thioredoxin